MDRPILTIRKGRPLRHRAGHRLRSGTVGGRQRRLQVCDDRLELSLKPDLVLVSESTDSKGKPLSVRTDPKPDLPVEDEG